MKIWLDADNGPHVLIMRPLVAEFTRRGHEVRFTARNRSGTCELLDLYGLPYTVVGGDSGAGTWRKVSATLSRAAALAAAMRRWAPDVSFGHGSRPLPLASLLLRVPSVTMYDYEWVDPRIFNLFCRNILLPSVVDPERCREAGIRRSRVRRYPGYKEHLYLDSRELEPLPIQQDLGLDPACVHVLVRPPATHAHYHNPEAETILAEILAQVAARSDVQIVFLQRGPDQLGMVDGLPADRLVVPRRVYDGPSLIAAMDLVVSGGGTMTREAAILGVPSYTYFRGRTGRVDESLERAGRLVFLRSREEVAGKLELQRRSETLDRPASGELVRTICDAVESAASA
ncbi:MAG: DUF354 domain-containing protein [Candidatus Krumholzibacteriia bacterium]